jgi:putative oxidoreductase
MRELRDVDTGEAVKTFTPGRPHTKTEDMMDSVEKFVPALGRFLLALVFVLAGFGKIWGLDATAAQMASHGIPMPHLLVYGVVALEFGGGLALMFGLFTRPLAFIFAIYLLTLALVFHDYWAMPAAEMHAQRVAFLEHLAMLGGMLYVLVFGAGAWSLDALIGLERPRNVTAAARA